MLPIKWSSFVFGALFAMFVWPWIWAQLQKVV